MRRGAQRAVPQTPQVVSRTASPYGGAGADCNNNTRAAFAALFEEAASPQGWGLISEQLGLCPGALTNESDATTVAMAVMLAFDTAAMGSLPYPSSYFTGGWVQVARRVVAGEQLYVAYNPQPM